MSLFSNIITWALHAAASDQGKQIALKAVGQGADALLAAVTQHSPQMAASIKPLVDQAVAQSVAGIMTRIK